MITDKTHKVEISTNGDKAPNAKPLLVMTNRITGDVDGEIELSSFLSVAQHLFELEAQHNLEQKPGSKRFRQLVIRCRKGLGFSYPSMGV